MYALAAPPARIDLTTTGYGVTRLVSVRPGTGTVRLDPASAEFLRAALPAQGVEPLEDRLHDAQGWSFSALAELVLPELAGGERLDLVVLAHTVPDLVHNDVAGAMAIACVPGGATAAFAVSELGSVTPFTALTLARVFGHRNDAQRVAVLVVDQATLPYELDPGTTPHLAGAGAVALLLERGTSDDLEVVTVPVAQPASSEDVAQAAKELLVRFGGDAPGTRVVVNHELGALWMPPGADVTGAGYPCTDVWHHVEQDGDRATATVVLSYDANVGRLGCARLDPDGARARPS